MGLREGESRTDGGSAGKNCTNAANATWAWLPCVNRGQVLAPAWHMVVTRKVVVAVFIVAILFLWWLPHKMSSFLALNSLSQFTLPHSTCLLVDPLSVCLFPLSGRLCEAEA